MCKAGGGTTHSNWGVAGSCSSWLLVVVVGYTGHSHISPPFSSGNTSKGRSERKGPGIQSTFLQEDAKSSLPVHPSIFPEGFPAVAGHVNMLLTQVGPGVISDSLEAKLENVLRTETET